MTSKTIYLFKVLAQVTLYIEEKGRKCFFFPLLYLSGSHDHLLPRPRTEVAGAHYEQFSYMTLTGFSTE